MTQFKKKHEIGLLMILENIGGITYKETIIETKCHVPCTFCHISGAKILVVADEMK